MRRSSEFKEKLRKKIIGVSIILASLCMREYAHSIDWHRYYYVV